MFVPAELLRLFHFGTINAYQSEGLEWDDWIYKVQLNPRGKK